MREEIINSVPATPAPAKAPGKAAAQAQCATTPLAPQQQHVEAGSASTANSSKENTPLHANSRTPVQGHVPASIQNKASAFKQTGSVQRYRQMRALQQHNGASPAPEIRTQLDMSQNASPLDGHHNVGHDRKTRALKTSRVQEQGMIHHILPNSRTPHTCSRACTPNHQERRHSRGAGLQDLVMPACRLMHMGRRKKDQSTNERLL